MNIRNAIIIMSALGMMSDTVLIGFYPQFFDMRYGNTDHVHTGMYVAAISIAVMCTLPVWVRVAKRLEPMSLIGFTQCVAGLLCLSAIWAETLTQYWVLTMLMFIFKSSYLLMFPYLMRIVSREDHSQTIALLSVVVHISGIFAAASGGYILQHIGASAALVMMAAGDFAQMGITLWLNLTGRIIKVNGVKAKKGQTVQDAAVMLADDATTSALAARDFKQPTKLQAYDRKGFSHFLKRILTLSLIMFLFDFSIYLIRPFFSEYWIYSTANNDQALAGLIFAIPGLTAVVALIVKRCLNDKMARRNENLTWNLLLLLVGLCLQSVSSDLAIVIGRCMYGWGRFQVAVKLEVSLFSISRKEDYAHHFSITNFFQNLGVLISSWCAGYIVGLISHQAAFFIAAAGIALTWLVNRLTLNLDRIKQPVAT
ncbi:MFS transporter [Advenella mimigardefordensis]|uniref:Putative transport protein, MFS-type n=1 Tax=Advenella mimigardefordensis (strain DSM 17166 / LMG 22922 / DPN7) TaxID=1247726 RepID=W0PGX8_ADVMD|nr:MFS transporter [Advenella mimigardefordensis]AHG64655.1 putative transport protein, MFS-type [Advenella mimigardefordensis DPN7]